ncbi:MAG: saccharopine dehydrogenase NADP-binding domain-containing protein [Pseudomonas chlororaphis]
MNALIAPRKIIFVGFGSIAESFVALLSKTHDLDSIELVAIDPLRPQRQDFFQSKYNLNFIQAHLDPNNLRDMLTPLVERDSFLINLSTDVSSLDLIEVCHEAGALYLDTCIEPWPGGYSDPGQPMAQRTNYHLRERMLKLKKRLGGGPTAVVAHGANPGLVSHFVKQALVNLANDLTPGFTPPQCQEDWARTSKELGVKVIHIAEYDSQVAVEPKARGEFVNTWSVNGFISEAQQPAELGWGSHERTLPEQGFEHESGSKAAIYIGRPGATVQLKTWTPYDQETLGFLVTHNEAISIAEFLSGTFADEAYRPTVNYAYRPCDNAILSLLEWLGKSRKDPLLKRVLKSEDISGGSDHLGVLLMGHQKSCYWYGSTLSIDQARKLAPLNTATTLQVAAGVLSGYLWALNHPNAGMVEAEEMDYQEVLGYAAPYLGGLQGFFSDWNPVKNDPGTFAINDPTDVWQFNNFLV